MLKNKVWMAEEITDLAKTRMAILIKGKFNIRDYSIEDFKWNLAAVRKVKF